MKKVDWKLLNLACWVEAALCFLLPLQVTGHGFTHQAGFPFPFLSLYNTQWGWNLLQSVHVNPLWLVADVVLLYVAGKYARKWLKKLKRL